MASTASELLQAAGALAIGKELGRIQRKQQDWQRKIEEQQWQQRQAAEQQTWLDRLQAEYGARERLKAAPSWQPPAEPEAPPTVSPGAAVSALGQIFRGRAETPWAAPSPEQQQLESYLYGFLPGFGGAGDTQMPGPTRPMPSWGARPQAPQGLRAMGMAAPFATPGRISAGPQPARAPIAPSTRPSPAMAPSQMPGMARIQAPVGGGIGIEVPSTMRPSGPGELGTTVTALKGAEALEATGRARNWQQMDLRSRKKQIADQGVFGFPWEIITGAKPPPAGEKLLVRAARDAIAVAASEPDLVTAVETAARHYQERYDKYLADQREAEQRAYERGMDAKRLAITQGHLRVAQQNAAKGGPKSTKLVSAGEYSAALTGIQKHLGYHQAGRDPLFGEKKPSDWAQWDSAQKADALNVLAYHMATVMMAGENPFNLIPSARTTGLGNDARAIYKNRTGKEAPY